MRHEGDSVMKERFPASGKRSVLALSLLAGISALHGQTWTNLISGAGSTASDYVLALAADSSANMLYVGGTYNSVSGLPFTNLVK